MGWVSGLGRSALVLVRIRLGSRGLVALPGRLDGASVDLLFSRCLLKVGSSKLNVRVCLYGSPCVLCFHHVNVVTRCGGGLKLLATLSLGG